MLNILLHKLTRTKPLGHITKKDAQSLPKVLSAFDLVAYGVGCIIGAGIFVLTGVAAKEKAGPAIIVSFAFDAVVCICSALCYSEIAARYPVAGSAYTYAYIAVGEIYAWMTGLSLIAAYVVSSAAVARGWSGYLQSMCEGLGVHLPDVLVSIDIGYGFNISILAGVVVLLVTIIAVVGVKQSAVVNNLVSFLAVVIILGVIFGGIVFIDTKNWTDNFTPYGLKGISAGAATVFFAYVGFDSVANLSEEVTNPNRNIPIGIIGSLIICTFFYMGVSLVVTGMVNYSELDLDAPLAKAFASHGVQWAEVCIAFGAFAGLTTTILTLLCAIPRVFMSMGLDGLLPKWFGVIHPTYQTPLNSAVVSGILAAVLAVFFDIDLLSSIVSLGILAAFTISCACILLLRLDPARNQFPDSTYKKIYEQEKPEEIDVLLLNHPRPLQNRTRLLLSAYSAGVLISSFSVANDVTWIFVGPSCILFIIPFALMHYYPGQGVVKYPKPRSEITHDLVFSCPWVPTVPLLGIGFNIYMAANLESMAYILFFGWIAVGLLVYFGYGIRFSRLNGNEYTPLLGTT